MKALLVEDDTGMLNMMDRILSDRHEIEVAQARTLKDGVHTARQMQPDLIVADLALLPDSTPENTIERGIPQLTLVAPKAAILIYSGYLDYERIKLALQMGANAVIEKSPIHPRRAFLMGIIEALSNKHESPAVLIELIRGMLGHRKSND